MAAAREFPLIQDPSNHSVMGWAPDGKHILFQSDRSGSHDAWLIAVADGKAEGEPTLVKKDFSGTVLGFARSGAFYYAVANSVRDVQIAELDPASGDVASPPQPASRRWVGITRAPDWSPDGRSLAYIRNREPSRAVIIVCSIDTGEERELQVGEWRLGTDLRWAQDGKAIVVPGLEPGKKTPSGEASAGRKCLARVEVQTGQIISLMAFPENVGGSPPFDLSPDGKTVFYINRNRPLGWEPGPGSTPGPRCAVRPGDAALREEGTLFGVACSRWQAAGRRSSGRRTAGPARRAGRRRGSP